MTKFLTKYGILYIFTISVKVHANVVGIGAQNFNSIPSGLDFVTVHSAETLDPGIVNMGLFLNYAVNTLPYFDDTATGRLNFKDGLLSSDFNIGVGVLKNWELGVSFPAVVSQNEQDSGYRGEFVHPGFTEIRFASKWRFLRKKKFGVGGVVSANWNRVRNDPLAGSGAGPTLNFEAVFDFSLGKMNLGLNLGFRKRNPGSVLDSFPISPLGDQWIFSLAASYPVLAIDSKIVSEIFAGLPANSQDNNLTNRSNSSAEILVGIKHDVSHSFSVHGGVGTELIHARSSPDWRIYSGVNYVLGPYWSKDIRFKFFDDVYVLTNIEFHFDSNEMTKESQAAVESLIVELQKAPGFKSLVIEGHTDSVGNDDYNKSLSLKRAQAIVKYLVGVHGFNKEKLYAEGYGEERPVADNGNYQGRQKNRRVEFKLRR
jgi:outer membrane protein OmpA-like peptidoglycan-associated protein